MPESLPWSKFWDRVEKTEGCWVWTGAFTKKGYGQVYIVGRGTKRAHRIAWELKNGPIPVGLWVLHRCDTPACVRPSHLFLGTNSTNQLDASNKGRHNQTRKRHCPKGHAYTKDKRGYRICLVCHREVMKRSYQKEKINA